MIKVVFIDIDNTLLSFDEYVKLSMREGFDKFGLREYENWMFGVFLGINSKLWRQIENKEITFEQLGQIRWNMVFEKLDIDFDGVEFERYFRDCLRESAIPVDGAYEMLDYLRDRYILCAASNGPSNQQINRLRLGRMLDYFTAVYVSEDLEASKPSELFFKRAFDDLENKTGERIKPEETLIIGDSLTADMIGGTDFGMKTCWYNRHKAQLPKKVKLDFAVERLEDVKNIL
ncbi:MAG: HAD-IA family hydrolase [Ruminococcus sp.]|nr:HAD-IA family hydrolase [Ruminococcus sp.]